MDHTIIQKSDQSTGIVRHDDLEPLPVAQILARRDAIQSLITNVMIPGKHYGIIPGTKSPTLYKAGSELMLSLFQLSPHYEIERVQDGRHLTCYVTAALTSGSGTVVSTGRGSCTTKESRYRWRKGERLCPECGKPTILRSKNQDADGTKGWFCWAKKGGCGEQFKAADKRVTDQNLDRCENPDIEDQHHTVEVMACKRSLKAAITAALPVADLLMEDRIEDVAAGGAGVDPVPGVETVSDGLPHDPPLTESDKANLSGSMHADLLREWLGKHRRDVLLPNGKPGRRPAVAQMVRVAELGNQRTPLGLRELCEACAWREGAVIAALKGEAFSIEAKPAGGSQDDLADFLAGGEPDTETAKPPKADPKPGATARGNKVPAVDPQFEPDADPDPFVGVAGPRRTGKAGVTAKTLVRFAEVLRACGKTPEGYCEHHGLETLSDETEDHALIFIDEYGADPTD